MDNDIKNKWVAALRSGKYRQGRGHLRNNNDEYCCLGVLCDVVDTTRWESGYTCYEYEECSGQLPSEMVKYLDISDVNQSSLINMNDIKKSTFEEIADWIEKNV